MAFQPGYKTSQRRNLENHGHTVGRLDSRGLGHHQKVKLVVVDLTAATDVKDFASAATVPLVLENVNTGLAALGITPATTPVVWDAISELPAVTDFKWERLAILSPNEVAVILDNDFGIGQTPNAETRLYSIRLSTPLR